MNINVLSILLVSLMGLIQACGEDILVEETTQLVEFSANIESGQTKVSVQEAFRVTFPTAIDPTTVTSTSLFLVEDKATVTVSEILSAVINDQCLLNPPIMGSVTCSTDNLNCTLSLDSALSYDTAYLLCLLDQIKLADAKSGSFLGNSVAFRTLRTFTISVTASGIIGEVVLQNNEGDDLEISESGNFTFSSPVEDGAPYKVTLLSQPSDVTCSVGNASGTISSGNVANITLICSTEAYPVGGTITGLTGTVVLQNNATGDKSVSADGSFTFLPVADGGTYEVTVLTQPDKQTCVVSDGTGVISGKVISNVSVSCTTNTFSVGGTISGLSGAIVLQINGGDNLSTSTNGSFTFSTKLVDGTTYTVTILTQPPGQTCTIAVGTDSSVVNNANVASVVLTCVTNPLYKRIFFSTASHHGNFDNDGVLGDFDNGVLGADNFCNIDANKPEGSGPYKAMILSNVRVACVTPSCPIGERVDWVLSINTIYAQVDGITIIGTTNEKAIFEFPLVNPIDPISGLKRAWTGMTTQWIEHPNTCNRWFGNAPGVDNGAIGDPQFTTDGLIQAGNDSCNQERHLYCVEQ
jgi:hypothetical protein